ncbi:unnamed protein product [Cylindrotheca closterium]|uniref:Subtilisin n=1 Tax=Cylindrotheca closterium TaxID=2856 RepID=A0AAD2G6K1_9STRA|nr:unnamed protein product [Cylindrotheca closterium]
MMITMRCRSMKLFHVEWLCLFLLISLIRVEGALIGSKNITFVNERQQQDGGGRDVIDSEDGMPYRPYNDSASFQRFKSRQRMQSRASRPVNTNPDDVVSCGSCCFDVLPLRGSSFVSEEASPYREILRRNRFYVKLIDIAGIPLVASYDVRDAAMLETALLLVKMASKNPHLMDYLKEEQIHFAVIGKDEVITDLPSYSDLDPQQWDYARGVGATRWRPVSSCAEEDVLCLSNDPYLDETICVHEHAHTLEGSGGKLDSPRMIEYNGREQNLDSLLKEVYNDRITDIDSAGRPSFLWENTYASSNHEEMWAEGVQSYYNVNREGPAEGDGVHNHIWSRSLLQSYHRELHQVIEAVFPSEVNLECPGTSMDSCDCNQIRQLCEQVGVTIPTNGPTKPPTRLPTFHPTQKPTPGPNFTPFPTPKPSPSPSRSWPSSNPTNAPSINRVPGMALGVSAGRGNAPKCFISLILLAVCLLS